MEPTLFEAMIEPHRSLGRRGRRLVLGLLAVALALSVAGFALVGAWPVGGIAGIELLVAMLFFRWHGGRDRRREELVMTETEMRIRRVDAAGRERSTSLPAAWLSARMEERPGRAAALIVRAAGREEEIGALLGEGERRDLAAALDGALHRLRHPRFDHAFPVAGGG